MLRATHIIFCVVSLIISLPSVVHAQNSRSRGVVFFKTASGPVNKNSLPQTTKLIAELAQMQTTLGSLQGRLQRLENKTEQTRQQIDLARRVVKTIGQIDDQLARLIRELTPISKLPPTRMLRTAVRALEQLKSKVHPVRVKADRFNREMLTPLRAKVRNAEIYMERKITEVQAASLKTSQTRNHISQLLSFVNSRGNPTLEVRTLEYLSSNTRKTIDPVNKGLNVLNNISGSVEMRLNAYNSKLEQLVSAGQSLSKMQKGLQPIDNVNRKINTVMSKRIEVKLFGKRHGFTIRQVIEGPGKVADFILKPLEIVAKKALSPVLKGLRVEVPTPKGLDVMDRSLDSLRRDYAAAISMARSLESAVANIPLNQYQTALANLLARSSSNLR